MTSEQLAEIRARAEAATPGPWNHETSEEWGGTGLVWQHRPDWEPGMFTSPTLRTVARCEFVHSGWNARSHEQTCSDANFIAHARSDIPALLNEVERLREALEEISKPPYKDSDLESLMAWVNARARAALEEK